MSVQVDYFVYKSEDLINCLNQVKEEKEDVHNFFSTFTYNKILSQNYDKENSSYLFKNAIKEDTTKSKIIYALNKLNQENLTKIISTIREIKFEREEELVELVNQCIQKIKRETEQIKQLVGELCSKLLLTYFLTETGEKIYLRKILLTMVKNDYEININYNDENWTKEKGEKSMILIGTLFNNKIIEDKVMMSIIDDFKKKIIYKNNNVEEDFQIVEKSIQLLSCLISTIIKTPEVKKTFNHLDLFLEQEMVIYEEKKCISKKNRLVCKNIIYELAK